MGFLLLEGGAEFGGAMSEPDLAAIRLADGLEAPIAILPTAAAPDHNQDRAGRNALSWFRSLGASRAEVVPVVDRQSANDPALAERIRNARLIYMLGGFPGYLADTLRGSLAWKAAIATYARAGVIGGSSAGAMVLCEHFYDPDTAQVEAGLNLVANACVIPHHNGFGRAWSSKLTHALPDAVLIGIDERTGILNDTGGRWTAYGAGQATLYRGGASTIYGRQESFSLV